MLGIYGKSDGGTCFIENNKFVNDTLELVYSCILSLGTILYCLPVSARVVIKARKQSVRPHLQDPSSLASLRILICRTCMYPVACFLCCVGLDVSIITYYCFGTIPEYMRAWIYFGLSAMGILNLAAFLGDPLVFRSLSQRLRTEEIDTKEQIPLPVTLGGDFSYNRLVDTNDGLVFPATSQRDIVREFQTYI